MALWLHGCGNIESVCLIAGTTRCSAPIGSTRLAGFLAFLVALPAVPDLFICPKHLFFAAMRQLSEPRAQGRAMATSSTLPAVGRTIPPTSSESPPTAVGRLLRAPGSTL